MTLGTLARLFYLRFAVGESRKGPIGVLLSAISRERINGYKRVNIPILGFCFLFVCSPIFCVWCDLCTEGVGKEVSSIHPRHNIYTLNCLVEHCVFVLPREKRGRRVVVVQRNLTALRPSHAFQIVFVKCRLLLPIIRIVTCEASGQPCRQRDKV